ncbi:AAA family ATPase [Drechmeria coniospora]|uniref:AAA family ATPase n=1 Tax=Drechmeria coniospora TaxID=98403 RepID=A0A151GSN2_DRECN|nr:AAA family ATPase [Drechmeria coniospora]KYK60126.1 AAA family ATPase [Drechmeria coniospora]
MANKRKRLLEDFDPNKSDSEDENFDPAEVPVRRSSKKARPSRGSRPGRSRGHRYRGSDIDEDDEELSDSQDEGSFAESESEENSDAPVNAAGRRVRKAARSHNTYKESSEDEEVDLKDDENEDPKDEDDDDDPETKPEPGVSTSRRLVRLKVPKAAAVSATRRTTRASTADAEEFVELSNSGRHAVTSRDSRSKSPETFTRMRRSSRAMKGLKIAPEPIEPIQEATQESSAPGVREAEDPAPMSPAHDLVEQPKGDDQEMNDTAMASENVEEAQEAPKAEADCDDDDDDDDDVRAIRRTRASRAVTSINEEGDSDADAKAAPSRRLTRGSRGKKSTQEPSSDFEPGDESEDAEMSGTDKEGKQQDDDDSPTPRGRTNQQRARTAGRHEDSGDEEPDFDLDELNEEARELRQSSRPRRRQRHESPIVYQEPTRRARTRVNYYMPPLTSANIEEEEAADAAPTPSRNRRGRGGGGWERHLNTTFGPFGGGGGVGSLLAGPWGTGAAGGADSDSSDDEMVHRSSVAGNVGLTPTSATPGGFLPGGAGLMADNAGTAPNVGKIKDRKALADADPLGVDLNVDFSKVGGLQGHIDQLKEMVQLPLLYPELFTKFHVTPPRGVLFHGPPGTGKTLLARALANSVGSGGRKISFYMRKGADALSKWVGEAEKQLRLLFEEARKTQPSIIFFDEIDGLAPVRSSKQEQIHASIVSTLLALMDGMDGRGQVIVIGATNRPDNIDPALRRPGRFDREFYFPLPDLEGRRSILDIHTKDWGLSEPFKVSLADKTKGYGGADLRALCTEAALNSIQRTYPQIYSSGEKLVVDADKIAVHASDFMISIKKLIPSSERSATSGAQPLPRSVEPLLRAQLGEAKRALDHLLPRKKKMTALEEAMYEQFDDDDHGFGREVMHQEFERSRVFRPRFLIYGVHGMGQTYIASSLLHYIEGVHVQNFDLPSLLADGRSMEQVIVGLFTEVRRHKPSVIYIPNIDAWYATLTGTVALITFQTMLRSISPTDPVLLLATAECEKGELPGDLVRDFFGFSRKNRMEIPRPERANRMEYFSATLEYVKKKPGEFPDPENRKRRTLEELPVAPPIQPRPPTKAERKMVQKRDHQLLNALKIQLQPIMDQINRKYKKLRQPVIAQAQIDYLFSESDPNFVRPDIAQELDRVHRPYEIVKDKNGHDILRCTSTGKSYYNLETTTIEERLSNGYYARPQDFLFDIKALAKDAKNIGDKERTLKANELLSNVEVDVASIEIGTGHVDWEALYQRQMQRAKESAEKERKQKAMQSITDAFQSEQAGGNDSDAAGPVMLGEPVPGSRTTARFRLRSPMVNGQREASEPGPAGEPVPHGVGNGMPEPSEAPKGDVRMSGLDEEVSGAPTQPSLAMGPPAKSSEEEPVTTAGGMTQISQRSAVTSLPAGVSPSAVLNDASTTKTSDASTHHRSSNWSTQLTNGLAGERRSHGQGNDGDTTDIPDTLPPQSQVTSSDDMWPHSQAHGLARGNAGPSPLSSPSQARMGEAGSRSAGAPARSQEVQVDEEAHLRNMGSSASQPLSVEGAVENFLVEVTDGTSGCTIEQLEQINRELMDEIWSSRHEWNRMKVLGHVTKVFNDTIGEIEVMQGMAPASQE